MALSLKAPGPSPPCAEAACLFRDWSPARPALCPHLSRVSQETVKEEKAPGEAGARTGAGKPVGAALLRSLRFSICEGGHSLSLYPRQKQKV